jgi:choline dehydrogenase-like flavoprotein
MTISAPLIVLAAGAVNSAALLLKSANGHCPRGLANSSDMVGRNFMNHNCSALMAVNPFKKNDAVYQKTIAINDFYLGGGDSGQPLGNLQLLGKINGTILSGSLKYIPMKILNWISRRSVDWYVMSEDLPDPESRVKISENGQIILDWKKSNMSAHDELVRKARKLFKSAGFPIVISQAFDRRTPSHQCGTVRMGNDPKTSPLDIWCESYDHKNLYVVDASFLPTSAAVNPALTIAAQALRVADSINREYFSHA